METTYCSERKGVDRGMWRAGSLMVAALCALSACSLDDTLAGPDSDEETDSSQTGGKEDSGAGSVPDPLSPLPGGIGVPDEPLPNKPVEYLSSRASKAGTIDITQDDAYVAMVLPESGELAIFRTADNQRTARLRTGQEPSSVVLHPDSHTAFVTHRADATVVRVEGIDSAEPHVTATAQVGSEPAGVALSPGGNYLYVAEFAEGRVSVFDSASMELVGVIDAPEHPSALTVTNDGDEDESDESLIVPEFYGERVAGGEASNTGRTGRVRVYGALDLRPRAAITFAPRDSGFAPADGEPTVFTSPNQLASALVHEGKLYVTSVSVSPEAPVKFNSNVFPVVYVADLATGQEDLGPTGTLNLAQGIKTLAPAGKRLFMADLVDMAFVPGSIFGYVLARGADAIQRVVYNPAGVSFGSSINAQIDLLAPAAAGERSCQNPTGIVTRHQGGKSYVNCWLTRGMGVVDFEKQALTTVSNAADLPAQQVEQEVARGKRFFFTGRARWSSEAWSSCASCHPGGLSDGVTWSFPAGPRQTTSLDGSFSHGAGVQEQRVFNWTGIFDELHDFERNTRGVSGGLGAITVAADGVSCTAGEVARAFTAGGLQQPIKELQDAADSCEKHDWDDIERFVQQIRPPRALRTLDPEAVARGAKLFGLGSDSLTAGKCVTCHGGKGFTASRRFYEPESSLNASLAATLFVPPPSWPASWSTPRKHISAQPEIFDADGLVQQPAEVACAIRNVGTFGITNDAAATAALEKRDTGTRAQGAGGYNIPSLYGLSVGAPYLHHGQAGTLKELLGDPRFNAHLTAANPIFSPDARALDDLSQYLLSIDAYTPEQALPDGFDGCVFPAVLTAP